jgi:CBS domain-containing protein
VKVSDVMTKNVEVIHPEATIREAASKMKKIDVGMIPVCDGDRIVGMLSDRDITLRATAEGLDPNQTKVRETMSPKVVYAFEDQDVGDAARMMSEHQIRRLLIMSRNKRLTGILSLGDLAVDVGKPTSGDVLKDVSEPSKPKR